MFLNKLLNSLGREVLQLLKSKVNETAATEVEKENDILSLLSLDFFFSPDEWLLLIP